MMTDHYADIYAHHAEEPPCGIPHQRGAKLQPRITRIFANFKRFA